MLLVGPGVDDIRPCILVMGIFIHIFFYCKRETYGHDVDSKLTTIINENVIDLIRIKFIF